MITNPREEGGFPTKHEGERNEAGRISRLATTSTSRQWSGFRNPRIVRVSRTFGGKDRHSKVCTIRGLRDRRIRLSVPTAIQLYDLQDKLGLSQPSKVIDWLLDASKEDIDKLPPLQMPQGFGQFHQQMLFPHESTSTQSPLTPFFPTNSTFLKDGFSHSLFSSKHGIKINDSVDGGQNESSLARSRFWDMDVALRSQSKEVERQSLKLKGKLIEANELENTVGIGGHHVQVSAQNFFPIVSYSTIPSFPSNNPMPHYNQCEPSNLSLSQVGSHAIQTQLENPLINNTVSYSSSSALPTGPQLYFYPSTTVPSLLPPYLPYVTPTIESDPRQINHFQFLNSSSQHVFSTALVPPLHLMNSPLKSFQPNLNTKSFHLQDTKESQDGGAGDDDDT